MKNIKKTSKMSKINMCLFVGFAIFVAIPSLVSATTYGSDTLYGQSYGDVDGVSEYGYKIYSFETKCPTGQILVGIIGRYSVPEIDNLGIIICRDSSGNESQYGQSYGDINNVSEYGHAIHDFQVKCPSGEILTGFKGRYSKAEIENMGIIYCTDSNGVERQYGQSYGDVDGVSEYGYKIYDFEIKCPSGTAVSGFKGRYSKGEVDNFGPLYCREVSSCTDHASKKCSGNSVYWYDSCGNKQDLYKNCSSTQTCSNGECIDQNIECSSSSDCGTSGYTGDAFCQSGDVYKTYKTYTCHNSGTSSSYCSSTTEDRLITDCSSNQTCSNGSCVSQNIACSSSSDCGTSGYTGSPFCQLGNVYQNYITYTCSNPGSSNSYCSNSTNAQLKQTCSSNQTCSNGSCVSQNIACSSSSDCGNSGYIGDAFCSSGDVYKTYRTYTCSNAGTVNSSCSSSTEDKLITDCSLNQSCSNGSCVNQEVACDSSSDCGTNKYIGDAFCKNGDAYKTYRTYTCHNSGSSNSYCSSTTEDKLVDNCSSSETCDDGECVYDNNDDDCSPSHDYKKCSGNSLYWYDSCGNKDDLIKYCSSGCSDGKCESDDSTGYVTLTKTVKNLTTGSGFASSVSASPSDVLMFMTKIEVEDQDINDLYLKDTLSSGLIYRGSLVVSGNSDYSGNPISGMTFDTIDQGDIVTITYQVQVADAINLPYGTSTLTNSSYAESPDLDNNPRTTSSVFVTRSAVYGASSISTGLTNNFFVDSFFLPLLITIALLWMWRTGMFYSIERWLENKKKRRDSYKADKELSRRIEMIQKTEKV